MKRLFYRAGTYTWILVLVASLLLLTHQLVGLPRRPQYWRTPIPPSPDTETITVIQPEIPQTPIGSEVLPDEKKPIISALCRRIQENHDLTIIVKTGATEAWSRVPGLLLTYLRCANDFLLFSDLEDEIGGQHVYDALENVSDEIKETNPDFALYNLQKEYRSTKQDITMAEESFSDEAWALDKYKNIHIAEKVFELRPNSSWYLFIDADTYIVWSSILPWLERADSSKKHYLGAVAYLNEFPFAHGGSGYFLSQAAMRHFQEKSPGVAKDLDEATSNECCGDAELSRALSRVGINVEAIWPMINGEHGTTIPYSKAQWCHPLLTMHHVSSRQIAEMWAFEEARDTTDPVLIKDLYDLTISQPLTPIRDNWDNLSRNKAEVDSPAHASFDDCGKACKADKSCYTWMYSNQICSFGSGMRLGARKAPDGETSFKSGWDIEKWEKFATKKCNKPLWVKV